MQFEKTLQNSINFDKYFLNDLENVNIVLPGDLITSEQGYMHGHGTFEEQGKIYSSLVGIVEKTNRLIIVNPLKSNYNPQVGDIIVGRVTELATKKWKIDINSSGSGTLHLNSTYLPEQRIKTEEDELNMRQILAENDLACAEVHSINHDKTINLHTRSLKYGRLENGILVQVHNKLIKRQKHHFLKLDCGVHMIFSHNGMIWLSNIQRDVIIKEESQVSKKPYTKEDRINQSYIANILKIFNEQQMNISSDLINSSYTYLKGKNITADQLLHQEYQSVFIEFLKQEIERKMPTEINKLIKQGDFLNN